MSDFWAAVLVGIIFLIRRLVVSTGAGDAQGDQRIELWRHASVSMPGARSTNKSRWRKRKTCPNTITDNQGDKAITKAISSDKDYGFGIEGCYLNKDLPKGKLGVIEFTADKKNYFTVRSTRSFHREQCWMNGKLPVKCSPFHP